MNLSEVLYLPMSIINQNLNPPTGNLNDHHPTVESAHVSRSLTHLYCSHCSHSYHFKLSDNQDEQMAWFISYHGRCIKRSA